MTYLELYHKAGRLLDDSKITLGEYEKMIEPLEREVSEWIPVSERLPEAEMNVLVYDDSGGMPTMEVDALGYDKHVDAVFWYRMQNVTHWMPLPKPPKTNVKYRVVEYLEIGKGKRKRKVLLNNVDADCCWDFLQKLHAERYENIEVIPCVAN